MYDTAGSKAIGTSDRARLPLGPSSRFLPAFAQVGMIGVSLAMPDTPEVSVVVAVRDEEANVAELERQLRDALTPNHEILFVDDGSTDATWSSLLGIHDPGRVRLVRLRAPSGKSAALMAGFARARAPIVFTLDGDLQDDPAEIPAFLEKLRDGYDLVSGWKRIRHDPLHKVAASRIFNFVMRYATGMDLHDMNCGFKCYRAEVTGSLRIYGDQHRFIPVFAAHQGYRVGEIPVRHRARQHGRSKYGLARLVKGFLDLGTILLRTRFRDRPAHAFGFAALACLAGGAGLSILSATRLLGHRFAIAVLAAAVTLGIGAFALLACGWLAEVLLDRASGGTASVFPAIGETRD